MVVVLLFKAAVLFLKGAVLYCITVLKWLLSIHTGGTLFMKIRASGMLALYISPFAFTIDKLHLWYLENISYVDAVFWAILIDYILGTFKHTFIDHDFSAKKNITGLLTKIALVIMVGYLFEALNTIIVEGGTGITGFVEVVARLMVFLYPAGNAFGNSSIITKGVFPPIAWILWLNKFKENLNPMGIRPVDIPETDKPKTDKNEPYQNNNPFR